MESELPFRKIILDSRNAVVGDSSSSFIVQLPSTLQLPPQTAAYVLDVAISYGFYTVETGFNDTLYLLERYWNGTNDVTLVKKAVLQGGSYTPTTLASAIQTSLDAVSVFDPNSQNYTVNYESTTNTILITLAFSSAFPSFGNYHGFTILSKKMLEDPAVQAEINLAQSDIDYNNIRDASGLLSLQASTVYSHSGSLLYDWKNPNINGTFPKTLRSGHIDVRSRHVLYLHSEALAGMRTIGPAGSRSVIARIPVTTTFGGMLFKEHSSHHLDFIPVGGRTITNIDIAVRDSFGELVNLHGGHCSLEILFAPQPDYA